MLHHTWNICQSWICLVIVLLLTIQNLKQDGFEQETKNWSHEKKIPEETYWKMKEGLVFECHIHKLTVSKAVKWFQQFNNSTKEMTLYQYWLGLLGLRELCYPLVLGHPLKGKYAGTVPLHITSRDGRISHLKPRKIFTWVSCLC